MPLRCPIKSRVVYIYFALCTQPVGMLLYMCGWSYELRQNLLYQTAHLIYSTDYPDSHKKGRIVLSSQGDGIMGKIDGILWRNEAIVKY